MMRAKQSHRARPRRAIVLPLLLVLTLATGLTLLGLAQLLTAGPVPPTDDRLLSGANLAVIRAFYAAANRTLSTGDPTGLDPLVAPDLVEHRGSAGSITGRAGLVQTLLTLHAGFPHVQLAVDDLVAQADEVVARVHLTGVASGQVLGLTLAASLAVWGEMDLFRLERGVIVEQWGGPPEPITLRPQQGATLVLPSATTVTSAARLTFQSAVTYRGDSMPGPKLLAVEAGQLTVTLTWSQGAAAVWTHGATGTLLTRELIRVGQPVTLHASDLLALPQGTTFTATDEPAASAVVCLLVALQQQPAFMHEAIAGPQAQHLADNLPGPLPRGAVAIALGAVTLAPGTTLPLTTTAGSTLVIVDAGHLGVTLAASGAWVQHGADATTEAIGWLTHDPRGEPFGTVGGSPSRLRRASTPQPAVLPSTTSLAPGDTALIEPGARGVIRNAGNGSLSLVVGALTDDSSVPGTPTPA